MKYCTKCVTPETRPGVNFDENGICNFCRYYDSLEKIDWEQRKQQLLKIAEETKQKKGLYDCVVGVSGGKDSTYMTLYARDVLGLRVLLVNMVPDNITENGRHNLDNLQRMGFDTVQIRPNPKICRKLAKMAFYKWGNPVKPSEYALYASSVRFAIMYKIPLVLFDLETTTLDADSKDKSSGDASRINEQNTLGWSGSASHLVCEGVTLEDLIPYQYPSQEEIKESGVKMLYLGYFKRWSPQEHAMFSIARGLQTRTDRPEDIGRYTNYHALDDDSGIVNQMIKYVKLGYGFTTDEVTADIWAGRITREEGIELLKKYDGKCSVKYIKQFCNYIDITLDEFWNVLEKFRGPMWKKNNIGEWILNEPII